jgi:hypothetical protein
VSRTGKSTEIAEQQFPNAGGKRSMGYNKVQDFFHFFFFCGIGIWTQGLVPVSQVLYCLSHACPQPQNFFKGMKMLRN